MKNPTSPINSYNRDAIATNNLNHLIWKIHQNNILLTKNMKYYILILEKTHLSTKIAPLITKKES